MGEKKLTVTITEELHDAIHGRADELGITSTEYMRRLAGLGLTLAKTLEEPIEWLYVSRKDQDGTPEQVHMIDPIYI